MTTSFSSFYSYSSLLIFVSFLEPKPTKKSEDNYQNKPIKNAFTKALFRPLRRASKAL